MVNNFLLLFRKWFNSSFSLLKKYFSIHRIIFDLKCQHLWTNWLVNIRRRSPTPSTIPNFINPQFFPSPPSQINVKVFWETDAGVAKKLVDLTEDFCKFSVGKVSTMIMSMVMPLIQDKGHIPKKCPIEPVSVSLISQFAIIKHQRKLQSFSPKLFINCPPFHPFLHQQDTYYLNETEYEVMAAKHLPLLMPEGIYHAEIKSTFNGEAIASSSSKFLIKTKA